MVKPAVAVNSTEAGPFHCSECNNSSKLVQQGKCLNKISSEICQSVDPAHRIKCTDSSISVFATTRTVGLCIKKTAETLRFLFDLLVFSAVNSAKAIINISETSGLVSRHLSSIKNYFALELYKAYERASGTESQRRRKAFFEVGSTSLQGLWLGVGNLLRDEYKMFGCYDKPNQMAAVCSVILGFVVPTGGVYAAINLSAKLVGKSGKALVKQNRNQKRIKNIIASYAKKSKPISKTRLDKLSSGMYKNIFSHQEKWNNLPLKTQKDLAAAMKTLEPKILKKLIQQSLKKSTIHNKKIDASIFAVILTSLISKKIGIVLPGVVAKTMATEVSDYVITNNVTEFIQDTPKIKNDTTK